MYGQVVGSLAQFHQLSIPPSASIWWKNLCRISWGSHGGDWISNNSRIKLGYGNIALLRHDVWLSDMPLLNSCRPRCSSQFLWQLVLWSLGLRYPLEAIHVRLGGSYLREFLVSRRYASSSAALDTWICSPHCSGLFLVSLTYILLSQPSFRVLRLSDQEVWILNKVQKSFPPSKVVAFSWQLLLDRVPTWSNLFSRGVITDIVTTACISV